MEMHRVIRCEMQRVMLVSAVFSIAACALLAAFGRLNLQTAAGAATGALTGAVNFCLLALSVEKISSGNVQPGAAKKMIRSGYALRMLLMAAVSIAAIRLLGVDPLCHALLLPSAGIAARIGKRR